jgi:hypothetical protein
MKESLRQKVNRDNGKFYQVGNHNLNIGEITGYIFLILAMLVYLIVDKAGFEHGWLGWLFLLAGCFFLVIGIEKGDSQSNT